MCILSLRILHGFAIKIEPVLVADSLTRQPSAGDSDAGGCLGRTSFSARIADCGRRGIHAGRRSYGSVGVCGFYRNGGHARLSEQGEAAVERLRLLRYQGALPKRSLPG